MRVAYIQIHVCRCGKFQKNDVPVVFVVIVHFCLQVHPIIRNESRDQTDHSSSFSTPNFEVEFLDLLYIHVFIAVVFGVFFGCV